MPDYIFSNSPWDRVYVGQIREPAGDCRRCWISVGLDSSPTVYHQPEAGFPSNEVDTNNLQGKADVVDIARHVIHDLPRVGARDEGALILVQQKWVQEEREGAIAAEAAITEQVATLHGRIETESTSASSLPQQYRDFGFQKKLGCLATDTEDGGCEDGSPLDQVYENPHWYHEYEKAFFDFGSSYREADLQNLICTAQVLQWRFDTTRLPPMDLIENMRKFGREYAVEDPRKVFEFFEWIEWLADDRSAEDGGARRGRCFWPKSVTESTYSINKFSTWNGLILRLRPKESARG